MSAVAFDTLKLARTLRDNAKMSQEQAEGIADALADAMSGAELATKADIREQGQITRTENQEVRSELKAEIQEVKAELKAEIQELRAEIHAVDLRLGGRIDALGERLERRAAETDAKMQSVRNEMIRWVLATVAAGALAVIGAMWTMLHNLPAAH